MIVITADGIHDDFAQAICVDDDALIKIQENPILLHDAGFIISVMDSKGDNAVIVRLELVGDRSIIKHARRLLTKYKSVSWYRNGKLFTRR
jgi:hypothetical protein